MAARRTARLILVVAIGSITLLSLGAQCVRDIPSNQRGDNWQAPWYCHGLDCPPFSVLKTWDGASLELRSYAPSLWVSTNVTDLRYDYAIRLGFLRLFEYISGSNERGWHIDMTAPVRVALFPGAGPFCTDKFIVSFYLPAEFQDGSRKPPAPNRDSLYIESTAAASYYVLSFPGFSSETKVIQHVMDMVNELDRLGEAYNSSAFYTAGYDSPFRILNRHNEIWIPKTQTMLPHGGNC